MISKTFCNTTFGKCAVQVQGIAGPDSEYVSLCFYLELQHHNDLYKGSLVKAKINVDVHNFTPNKIAFQVKCQKCK